MGSRPPGADIITIKLSPAGRILWLNRYDGPGGGSDSAKALSIDGSENIYVAGTVRIGDDPQRDEIAAICYGPEGEEKRVLRHAGEASPITDAGAMAVDHGGNVYVHGASRFGEEGALITVRYGQPFRRGDVDGNGELDLADDLFWLRWRYVGERPPPCLEAADVNDDGDLQVSDPEFLFLRRFQRGEQLPPPVPCGFDLHIGVFACESFRSCP